MLLLHICSYILIAAFFFLLSVIACEDALTMRIPDGRNAALFFVGLGALLTCSGPRLSDRLIGLFLISVPMLLIALAVPRGFGGGDIKLMAAGGFFLGGRGIAAALVIGAFSGGVYAVSLLFRKKAGKKDVFPFGPFLCAGLALAFFLACTDGTYRL